MVATRVPIGFINGDPVYPIFGSRKGYKSFAITMDRYGHLYPEAGEQVAEALERAFRTG